MTIRLPAKIEAGRREDEVFRGGCLRVLARAETRLYKFPNVSKVLLY